jgi:hypothetical protein
MKRIREPISRGIQPNLFIGSVLTSLFVVLPLSAAHAPSRHALRDPRIKTVPTAFQAWHPAFEKNNDYAEVWSGGPRGRRRVLFASLMITNLGLKTFDGIIDVQFYAADGSKYYLHKELRRDKVEASTTEMDVTIEEARVWRDEAGYHLRLRYEEMGIDLDIVDKTPSVLFGNGKVRSSRTNPPNGPSESTFPMERLLESSTRAESDTA